jgi:hypothetical protein
MRMTSLLVIAIGVIFIGIAVKDNLSVVMGEIKAIGQGTALQPGTSPQAPPGDCIDTKTGKKVPCINQNSLNQITQNLVSV